jgi:hypothetical protein
VQSIPAIPFLTAWTGDPKKLNGGGPDLAIFGADAVGRAPLRNIQKGHVRSGGL